MRVNSLVPSIGSLPPYVTKELECMARRKHPTANTARRGYNVSMTSLRKCSEGEPTSIRRPARFATEDLDVTPREDASFWERVLMGCKWQFVKWNSGKLLGYYVTLTASQAATNSMQLKRFPFKPLEAEESLGTMQRLKFFFSHEANAFYQGVTSQASVFPSEDNGSTTEAIRRLNSTLGSRPAKGKLAAESESMSPFYVGLLPLLRGLAEATGDPSLLARVMDATYYAKNVATYKLGEDGKIRRKDEPEIPISEEGWGDTNVKRKKKSGEDDNTTILMTALKNKESVTRVLRAFPVPQSFMWLIIVCALAMCLSVAGCIIFYVVYRNLYVSICDQFDAVYYIPEIYVGVNEPARYILQAISVQRYYHLFVLAVSNVTDSGLQNVGYAYPPAGSTGEFFNATQQSLVRTMVALNADLLTAEESTMKIFTAELFDSTCNYTLIEKNITLANLPYFMALQQVPFFPHAEG